MYRRKRRNRSTWFPILGTTNGEDPASITTPFTGAINMEPQAPGAPSAVAIPLIPDETFDPSISPSTLTLRDYVEGATYLLDRVVGKVWAFAPSENDTTISEVIACAALAVLPYDENANNVAIPEVEWDPLLAANADKPYLWRRTWRLVNYANSADPTAQGNSAVEQFGSVLDGGHLDTKGTKRAIRKNQRLYICWSFLNLFRGGAGAAYFVQYGFDLRVLGRMVKGRNKGAFSG